MEYLLIYILKVLCKIDYDGEEVLQAIVEQGAGEISMVIDFLKTCLMLVKSELKKDSFLDMEIVEKAKRMSWGDVLPPPVPGQTVGSFFALSRISAPEFLSDPSRGSEFCCEGSEDSSSKTETFCPTTVVAACSITARFSRI